MSLFAADYFGIVPDLITMAKGLTNGAVPMSAVAARGYVYDTFMQGLPMIELFTIYRPAHPRPVCSGDGHAMSCQTTCSTAARWRWWGKCDPWTQGSAQRHRYPHLGLMGVELAPRDGAPTTRAYDVI